MLPIFPEYSIIIDIYIDMIDHNSDYQPFNHFNLECKKVSISRDHL